MSFPQDTLWRLESGTALLFPTVTIENGETESSSVKLMGYALLKINIPANFQGTKLTFLVSDDNVTFKPYMNVLGQEVSLVAAANIVVGVAPIDFLGTLYLKLKSDVAELGTELKLILMGMK